MEVTDQHLTGSAQRSTCYGVATRDGECIRNRTFYKTEATCSTMRLLGGKRFKQLVRHRLLQRYRMDGDQKGAKPSPVKEADEILVSGAEYIRLCTGAVIR